MYDVVFDESFYSELAYTSQPYAEVMAMRLSVSVIPYATSPREQTSDIITITNFEEENLLSENHNDMESGNGSDDDSTFATLISEEEMDAMS